MENLRRFAAGLPANHVLLWGARGTGKSSLVKAAFMDLANTEAPGMRLVEIDRDAIAHLPALFGKLRGKPERFVVFCDDLSFEEGASAAKTLKSALEGGVSGPPDNVLFVATSNRQPPDAARPRRVPKGMLAVGRRGRGDHLGLRPVRPVDRLPAHGPAGLPRPRSRPMPSGSACRPPVWS